MNTLIAISVAVAIAGGALLFTKQQRAAAVAHGDITITGTATLGIPRVPRAGQTVQAFMGARFVNGVPVGGTLCGSTVTTPPDAFGRNFTLVLPAECAAMRITFSVDGVTARTSIIVQPGQTIRFLNIFAE